VGSGFFPVWVTFRPILPTTALPVFHAAPHEPIGEHRPSRPTSRSPQPEKATIVEQYAKGSIVIVNHERNLYFVEDTGQAIRYPVAIGSPVDQCEGVQTITAKRENPTWYPPEDNRRSICHLGLASNLPFDAG
jgi:lipoprotein-anchoring transpeptidase ErfK/SrfK